MAAHLTDKQKKKIIADYVECGSYNAVAKKHKVSVTTIRRICEKSSETKQKIIEKKEENTADILAHMEKKKDVVNEIIDTYLAALLDPERIAKANPSQLTTALGTLIDKFTMARAQIAANEIEDDPLTKALMEEAERMQNETD